jgi:hypothetical protein
MLVRKVFHTSSVLAGECGELFGGDLHSPGLDSGRNWAARIALDEGAAT